MPEVRSYRRRRPGTRSRGASWTGASTCPGRQASPGRRCDPPYARARSRGSSTATRCGIRRVRIERTVPLGLRFCSRRWREVHLRRMRAARARHIAVRLRDAVLDQAPHPHAEGLVGRGSRVRSPQPARGRHAISTARSARRATAAADRGDLSCSRSWVANDCYTQRRRAGGGGPHARSVARVRLDLTRDRRHLGVDDDDPLGFFKRRDVRRGL